ncbi:serine/threonine protein kinase [Paecilomyces lecythidis]|uniref:non-specific serine/threonine protein kinase n=1 Tax=Paecilomyces lecythidis TaxID=3004212 RepID=A0ABR3YAX3_9EURO
MISGEEVAIKCESCQAKYPRLRSEYNVYLTLGGGPGIPFVHWFGTEHNYNAIVIDFCGDSLWKMCCNRRLSLKSILLLALQGLSCIEHVHGKSLIHGDLKPENFVVGLRRNNLCMIDFGLTRLYRDKKTRLHIPYCENKPFTGSCHYASLNTHRGNEQSRRDDLESFFYVLRYMTHGYLPWQGLRGETRDQKYERITKKKMATSIETLCHGLPDEFATCLRYIRSLRFDEKPDYSYLRKTFQDLFVNLSFQYDNVFDWNVWTQTMQTNQNTVKIFSASEIFLEFSQFPLCKEVIRANIYRMWHDFQKLKEEHTATELENTPDDARFQEWADVQFSLLSLCVDILIASHHPAAGSDMQQLIKKSYLPELWNCGINPFLEQLQKRLPGSLEYLKAFIREVFSISIMFLRVAPTFENTWMEILGDIARCCLGVLRTMEQSTEEREYWLNIAWYWYKKCAHQTPNVGRLQHHLGILARPNNLQQLFHYTKSLISIVPFQCDTIQIFLDQFRDPPSQVGDAETIFLFLNSHAMLYAKDSPEQFIKSADRFLYLLDDYISQTGTSFCEQGTYIVSSNYAAILDYGQEDSKILAKFVGTQSTSANELSSSTNRITNYASYLSFSTLRTLLQRVNDKNVCRSVHVSLVFLWYCAKRSKAMDYIQSDVPWESITDYLNALILPGTDMEKAKGQEFPYPESGVAKELPEDCLIRGHIWSQHYYPEDYFSDSTPQECSIEYPSTMALRKDRCLWLGMRIALCERWITYHHETRFQTISAASDL